MRKTPEERAAEFIEKRKSLVLATVNKDGSPLASTVPFVRYWWSYYIYTSALSEHTPNLLAAKKVSIMCVEDESRSRNHFARRRYSCPCAVSAVERGSGDWIEVIDRFEKRFGKTFELIRELRDFTLFRLDPETGRYVEGFGAAFNVSRELDSSVRIGFSRPQK